MVPTLNVGDRLFVTRVYNLDKLQRGDILVFYSEELQEDLIKRLIGLPGDKIEIKNGQNLSSVHFAYRIINHCGTICCSKIYHIYQV